MVAGCYPRGMSTDLLPAVTVTPGSAHGGGTLVTYTAARTGALRITCAFSIATPALTVAVDGGSPLAIQAVQQLANAGDLATFALGVVRGRTYAFSVPACTVHLFDGELVTGGVL